MLHKNKKMDGMDNGYFSFTDEDQREQLQIFVDWLHAQRASNRFTGREFHLFDVTLSLVKYQILIFRDVSLVNAHILYPAPACTLTVRYAAGSRRLTLG